MFVNGVFLGKNTAFSRYCVPCEGALFNIMIFKHGTQWLCVQKYPLSMMKEGCCVKKAKTRALPLFQKCLSMIPLNVLYFVTLLCNLRANVTDGHDYRKTSGPVLSQVKE